MAWFCTYFGEHCNACSPFSLFRSLHSFRTQSSPKNVVHWFRRGLRLHDNPSLRSGLKGCTSWRCVYVIDPWFAGTSNVGVNKWRFLLESLEDLDRSLRKLNSRLFVIRGQVLYLENDLFFKTYP
jgi:cryptochrome